MRRLIVLELGKSGKACRKTAIPDSTQTGPDHLLGVLLVCGTGVAWPGLAPGRTRSLLQPQTNRALATMQIAKIFKV